ncbi:MAG: metalloregulator ArsR/SmtB family transcription factor [Deltaproteobacteria bacterium]|nr:metalloregulator ArsR/SmtB family transcription factor [Deltaproteobacteria bacterium]
MRLRQGINQIYETRARILKAIAHPTRLFILDKLKNKEYCVCELTKLVGADVSTVSKHLSIMKNAGILTTRKEKNIVYYDITCDCVTRYIECIDEVIRNTAVNHRKLLKTIK